jgi:hypothetical protein
MANKKNAAKKTAAKKIAAKKIAMKYLTNDQVQRLKDAKARPATMNQCVGIEIHGAVFEPLEPAVAGRLMERIAMGISVILGNWQPPICEMGEEGESLYTLYSNAEMYQGAMRFRELMASRRARGLPEFI